MENLGNNLSTQIAQSIKQIETELPVNNQKPVPDYKDYFFNDYAAFRYYFHKENKLVYLKNYIKRINEFVEDRKTEFYFNFNYFTFTSSEDGHIYFLTNENQIAMMLTDEKVITVIPEYRDSFILHEKPWDETKRSIDGKLVFSKEHPPEVVPSPFNHANFFSYKNSMIISWDKSSIYFYNLFTKIHARPFPHKFNIMGMTLGKFETVIILDKINRQLVWFNIFEQTKQISIDCDFLHPCKIDLQANFLFIEANTRKTGSTGQIYNLKKCYIYNILTYKLVSKLEGRAINISRKKPIYYSISSKGTLIVRNFMTGLLIEEIKREFIVEDLWLAHDEKTLFMLAKINHPMQSWIKIIKFELKRKAIKFEYDLKYNATNFFINFTKSKILHWNRDAKTITLEELNIDHNEIEFEFDRPMEKFDLSTNFVYFFHEKSLYKQNLASYEKSVILNRGNHNFRIKGKYYFLYSNNILAIFDNNDNSLFDNYIALNKKINKLLEEDTSEVYKEKTEEPNQNKNDLGQQQAEPLAAQNEAEFVESEIENMEESDENSDRFYEVYYPVNHNAKNNQIASLRKLMNDSVIERDFKNKNSRFENGVSQAKSMFDQQTQKILNEINWIYFLDFVDGNPSNFYFINLRNYQILIFQTSDLSDEPEAIYLENEIYGGRVTTDKKMIFVLLSDGKIKLWHLKNREKIRTFSVTGQSFELSMDEAKLFVLNEDGWLYVVEAETDKILHKILINASGISQSFSNFMVQENPSNPNELFILYNKKLKKHNMLPRINVWEYQCINAFFKPNKIIKSEEFDFNIVKYKEIYEKSIILQEYFNPIFVASLYSISNSLKMVLSKNVFKYPPESNLQIKPLLLALYNKDIDIAEILCEHFVNRKEEIYFSYEEMCLLMQMDYPFTKEALVKSIKQINPIEFDSDVYEWPDKLEKNLMICYQMDKVFNLKSLQHIKNLSDSALKLIWAKIPKIFLSKNGNAQQNQLIVGKTVELKPKVDYDNSRSLNVSHNSQKVATEIKIVKNFSQDFQNLFPASTSKQINYFLITGQFNFHDGSEDSRFFLRSYFKSNQTSFILSKFRLIVIDKWNRLNYLYKLEACFYICMTVFLTLTLFMPQELSFFIITLVFLGLHIGYESLSYYIEPHEYFKNKDNALDIFSILLGLTLTILTRVFLKVENYDEKLLNLFHIITLFVFYFRCTTYLKAFDILNPIVTMIFTVAFDIWDIILVLIVLIFGFSLLFLKAQSEIGLGKLLAINYFSFFGDIDQSIIVDNNYITWTVIICSTLFITFIMSNFIIARMSNNYDRMEQKQIEVTLKEKARLILEFETFINIFPAYRRKMRNLFRTKYYTLIAGYVNIAENFDQTIENKYRSKTSLIDSVVEFNEMIVEDLNCLNQRADDIDAKNKLIIQDLTKNKNAA